MPTGGNAPSGPDKPPGAILAGMRKQRGLSGTELAAMVGMSQPKISRIERGQTAPDPRDIELIARALGADEDTIHDLSRRTAHAQNRIIEWSPAPASLANRQDAVADWEADAVTVREFAPTIIPGLLQTDDYARAVLLAFQRLNQPDRGTAPDSRAVQAAVAARVGRQKMLELPDKRLHFVITENTLRQTLCSPEQMLAQISRLRTAAARPNVTVAVIPDGTVVDVPPLHSFMLFDDSLLLVDIYSTGLISRGREDVAFYRRVFDAFAQHATEDIDPILSRFQRRYFDELGRTLT